MCFPLDRILPVEDSLYYLREHLKIDAFTMSRVGEESYELTGHDLWPEVHSTTYSSAAFGNLFHASGSEKKFWHFVP